MPRDRAQLHGPAQHASRCPLERDVLAGVSAGGQDRDVNAKRRARARDPRPCAFAQSRHLELRVDRQQGRRVRQRSARALGGRSADVGDPALPRELRQPGKVQPHRAPHQPDQADRRAQVGTIGGRRPRRGVAHRRDRRVRRVCRRTVPSIGCHPHRYRDGVVRCGVAALATTGAARAQRRDSHQRRRSRHPRRRRVPGARPDRRGVVGRIEGGAARLPAGGRQRQQPDRHARGRAAAALRRGACGS